MHPNAPPPRGMATNGNHCPIPKRSPKYSDSEWEAMRSAIKYYYLTQDQDLKTLRSTMIDLHDFHASERQYLYRIQKWHMNKNIKQDDMLIMHRKVLQRAKQGKDTILRLYDDEVDAARVTTFVKRHRVAMTPSSLPQWPTPAHILAYTPAMLVNSGAAYNSNNASSIPARFPHCEPSPVKEALITDYVRFSPRLATLQGRDPWILLERVRLLHDAWSMDISNACDAATQNTYMAYFGAMAAAILPSISVNNCFDTTGMIAVVERRMPGSKDYVHASSIWNRCSLGCTVVTHDRRLEASGYRLPSELLSCPSHFKYNISGIEHVISAKGKRILAGPNASYHTLSAIHGDGDMKYLSFGEFMLAAAREDGALLQEMDQDLAMAMDTQLALPSSTMPDDTFTAISCPPAPKSAGLHNLEYSAADVDMDWLNELDTEDSLNWFPDAFTVPFTSTARS